MRVRFVFVFDVEHEDTLNEAVSPLFTDLAADLGESGYISNLNYYSEPVNPNEE